MRLTARVEAVSVSQTLAVKKAADALKAKGIHIIDFGPGEPDFPTPEHIKHAAKAAIDRNQTKYTAEVGIAELRQAIADKYNLAYGLQFKPENIIVTSGAKQALYHVAQALFEAGDEVIIPVPYWVSYPEQVRLNDAKPIFVGTRESEGFRIQAGQIEQALSSRTRAIVINSPSNPTGATLDREQLREIVALAKAHNIFVIFDECYESFLYEGKHCCTAEFDPDCTILINSVSKSYAMTGWRIGWAVAPVSVIGAFSKLQSHSTSHPTSIAQHAATAALRGSQECLKDMLREYSTRRQFVLEALHKIPNVSCVPPQGAFYVFPNISAYFNGAEIKNSIDFARYLLDEAHVAVVPGAAFGMEGHMRLSYATSMAQLAEGLERIQRALKQVQVAASF